MKCPICNEDMVNYPMRGVWVCEKDDAKFELGTKGSVRSEPL